MKKKRWRNGRMKLGFICLLTLFGSGFSNAWAADPTTRPILDQRFTLYGGVQFFDATGEFSSTEEGRPKVELDLNDLNLDENEISPVAGINFRLGKRWNLRLDYYGYHDDGKRRAGTSFNFGDLVVPLEARLDSSLDLDLYVANISFDVIHTEKARFGLGAGLHVADLDLDISASVAVGNMERSLGRSEENLTAPLPNVFVSGAYAITDTFILRYAGGWMSLSYDDWDGELWLGQAFLEYWPFQYVGIGAGYRYMSADVEYDSGDKKETYDVELPGPMVYLTVGF
jgi:hypothetical protein